MTDYLPRFSAKIWDDEDIYVNFYLYESNASDNPVILIKKKENPDEFYAVKHSLDTLYDCAENIVIAGKGEWFGANKITVRELQQQEGKTG